MNYLISIIIGMGLMLGSAEAALTNAPARIELPDQYEKTQRLVFPNTNITILTLADRKGCEQIPSWVTPISKRFGKRVNVQGIADVSAVPRLLRGSVRGAFRRDITYPVMLDWSGTTIQLFAPKADVTTVLVIAGDGRIVRQYEGAASPIQLEEICAMIEKMLSERDGKVTAKP